MMLLKTWWAIFIVDNRNNLFVPLDCKNYWKMRIYCWQLSKNKNHNFRRKCIRLCFLIIRVLFILDNPLIKPFNNSVTKLRKISTRAKRLMIKIKSIRKTEDFLRMKALAIFIPLSKRWCCQCQKIHIWWWYSSKNTKKHQILMS